MPFPGPTPRMTQTGFDAAMASPPLDAPQSRPGRPPGSSGHRAVWRQGAIAGMTSPMLELPAFLNVEASVTGRRWIGPSAEHDRLGQAIAQATGLPEIVGRILARRGVAAGRGRGLPGAGAARPDARPLAAPRHGPGGGALLGGGEARRADRRLRRLRRGRRRGGGARSSPGCGRWGGAPRSTSPTGSRRATGRTCRRCGALGASARSHRLRRLRHAQPRADGGGGLRRDRARPPPRRRRPCRRPSRW